MNSLIIISREKYVRSASLFVFDASPATPVTPPPDMYTPFESSGRDLSNEISFSDLHDTVIDIGDQ